MTKILRLSKHNILFIFIDLQKKLLDQISDSRKILERNILLLEAAKVLNLQYLVTTQYRKGLGELDARFGASVSVPIEDKTCFSCSGDNVIREKIRETGRECIVLSGVETHICVLQTCLDLVQEGYRVAVVDDAVGARCQKDHESGLRRMENSGALLVTCEMLIYELLGRSDTDAFKKLLPLLKNS